MGRDLITLIIPKTFCNHILITRHFFSKLKFRSWKFLSGVYVIFIECFEVDKSSQYIVRGIRHLILQPNKWVLISKNSYFEELIHILNIENVQFYKKWHFHHVSKWVNGWVIYKNSYFKVISMISLDHAEHCEYLR